MEALYGAPRGSLAGAVREAYVCVMGASLLVMAVMVTVMGSVGADRSPIAGSVDGDHLTLTTAAGVRCEGSVLRMTDDGGLGSVHCADGRRGSFEWTIYDKGEASGAGSLDGEPLTLHFHQG